MKSYAWLLGSVVAVCVLVGCGTQSLPEGFAPAFGTVTMDGKPLSDASVIFKSVKGESYGRTDSKGYYTVEKTRTYVGAAIGPNTVLISTKAMWGDEDQSTLTLNPATGEYVRKETVPARYNTRSTLNVDVTKDGAPYDFQLTTD